MLVDTPGFDDSSRSDCQILQEIAAWLEKTYDKGYRLNGLVYLHRINNVRMEGSARRALHVFQRVCGEDNYKNVVLATTFWNKMEHCKHEGIEREERLLRTEGFWKSMKDAGAKTTRLTQNYKEIIPALLEMAQKPKVVLDIQHELKSGLPLDMTMAGLFIKDEAGDLQNNHDDELKRLQEDFARRLQQHDEQMQAAVAAGKKRVAQEEERAAAALRKAELIKRKLERLEKNQRAKQAEVDARLREEQELQQRERDRRLKEEKLFKQNVLAKESRIQYGFSKSLRQKVEQQLEIFRMVRGTGFSKVSVPGIHANGTASRSGLNSWCDFCLEPFGLGQMMSKLQIHLSARNRS